jgi:hypothetical protein
MKSRRHLFAFLPLGVAAAVIRSLSAAPKINSATSTISFPVGQGVLSNGTTFNGGIFAGTLTLTGFSIVNGVLSAVGTLSGNLTDAVTGAVLAISEAITIPVHVSGSCTILTLTLGPLDLNLLGLMVHLNQVVLSITAVTGAGNLLGNLLCAVANLLNGGGPIQTLLGQLATLLNQILGAL